MLPMLTCPQMRGPTPTGIDHGTITATTPWSPHTYEITTYRADVETDGRHAKVAFSDSIQEDALRRIQEDFLRILRFFRFTATHGKRDEGVDADGLAASAMLASGLERVSNERIGTEICKLIMDFDPAPIIGSMEHSGVLLHILPGASSITLARLAIKHTRS